MKMPVAYIGIGSNIEPEKNIAAALRLIAEQTTVIALSTFYRTQALGRPESPAFYNGAAKLRTDAGPRELKLEILRKIETALGRRREKDKYAPRTIDLDIIIYDDLVSAEPDLIIPDPDIARREFVALPLLELDPKLVLPGIGRPLAEIAANMYGHDMEPLEEFSRLLRETVVVT